VETTLAIAGIETRFFGNYTGCSTLALTVELNDADVSPIIIKVSMAIYVRGTYRQTQLFYWLIIGRFTTTCFVPIPGPSSDCVTTYSRLYYMLHIGCFGELSIILRVTIHILYIIIFSTGINRPGVFCE